MRQKIANHIHHVDGGLLVGHGDVDVHAEDEQRTRQLLQLFDDIFVAFAGGDDLVDPAGEGMGAGGGYLQANAFGGGDQLTAGAVHFDAELADVFADFGAGLDDGLVHLVLDLLDDIGRGGGDELHYMRAQFARRGIDDLEFFFYADGEAVSHEVALRIGLDLLGDCEAVSYAAREEITSGGRYLAPTNGTGELVRPYGLRRGWASAMRGRAETGYRGWGIGQSQNRPESKSAPLKTI